MNHCTKHIPEGYLPCTREAGHEGPCAHPLAPWGSEPEGQVIGFSSWIEFFIFLAIFALCVVAAYRGLR